MMENNGAAMAAAITGKSNNNDFVVEQLYIINLIQEACSETVNDVDGLICQDKMSKVKSMDSDLVNSVINDCAAIELHSEDHAIFDDDGMQFIDWVDELYQRREQEELEDDELKDEEDGLDSDRKKITVSPFVYAVYKGCAKMVHFLLEYYKPDIETECTIQLDIENVEGVTPLWIAASFNYFHTVSVLLKYGANVNHGTKTHSTPLRASSFDSSIDVFELLIKHGADINLANVFHNNCLMFAAYEREELIVDYLIRLGADLDKQALCGATALHYAAQQGYVSIVKKLLCHGAKFLRNNDGHSPLMVAAINSSPDVVLYLISIPNLTTIQEKIDALELLGVSYATERAIFNAMEIDDIHHHFRNAFLYRYSGLPSDSYECVDITQVTFQPEQIPTISKPPSATPIVAYSFRVECQTMSELDRIKDSQTLMVYECILLMERHFGLKSINLAETLFFCGARFADNRQYSQCCELWIRAMKIQINAQVLCGEDYIRFVRLFELFLKQNIPFDVEHLEQIILLGVRYFTIRPKLFGYRELCYRLNFGSLDCFEKFTVKPIYNSFYYESENHISASEMYPDSDIVMISMLYLCSIVAKTLDKIVESDQYRLRKAIHQLCQLNITQSFSGSTLLHLALSTSPEEHVRIVYSLFNNPIFKYPSIETAKLLINCGADMNSTDLLYNTSLHLYAANVIDGNREMMNLDDTVELYELLNQTKLSTFSYILPANLNGMQTTFNDPNKQSACPPFYAGLILAHSDSINVFGQTVFNSTTNPISQFIFGRKISPLKCLASRVLHRMYFRCQSCLANNKEPTTTTAVAMSTSEYSCKTLNCLKSLPTAITVPPPPPQPQPQPSMNIRILRRTKYYKKFRDIKRFYDDLLNLPCPGSQLSQYCPSTDSARYGQHKIVPYDCDRVWRLMKLFSNRLQISIELVQFIEMHGSCKFIHLTDDF